MAELLVILGVLAVVALLGGAVGLWVVVRHIQRSRAIALVREMAGYGSMAVTAVRLRSGPDRTTGVLALRISRAHARLRQQVALAQRSGVELGDVPELLPRLQAAGVTIGRGLRHAAVGPAAPATRLIEEARAHLETVEDLSDAVRTAAVTSTADGTLARDAEEAASALRCRAAAYEELIAPVAQPLR